MKRKVMFHPFYPYDSYEAMHLAAQAGRHTLTVPVAARRRRKKKKKVHR